MIDPVVSAILRGVLAWLLLSAAAHKLHDLNAFRVALGDYQILPWPATALAAPGLAAAELAAGAALLSPWARPAGFAAAAALLALYTAAIVLNLARGRRDIDCGCFGPALRLELGAGLVARNAVLVAAALAGLLPPAPRPLGAVDLVSVLGGVAFLALAHAATGRLLAQAPALRALRSEP
jgi:hypothetical protein